MAKLLKIASISAEIDPFSKRGGLADVARALPKAFSRLGHKVICITPLYKVIDKERHNLKLVFKKVPVKIDKTTTINADFWRGELIKGVFVFFVDNRQFFSGRKLIYGSFDDNARFLFFNLAVLKLLTLLNFKADIIQCHDWHAGLLPYFLKKRFWANPLFKNTATIFTIHNLTFQMGSNWWEVPERKKDNGRIKIPPFKEKQRINYLNFAKRGILYSDLVNTVSEQYAKEVLTPEFGQDLHRILSNKYRKKRFFGIINGIDYFDYNPATDPGLVKNYNVDSLYLKAKSKKALQKEFHLPINSNIPLIGMVTRITEQKGFDLIREVIDALLRLDLQLVIVGEGEKRYEKFFQKISRKKPKKVSVSLKFDKEATRIYAGIDMFLMPSRFEPCGLTQLISLRYGSIPIVRATGGLVDTISDFNPRTGKGNGFVFKAYDPRDLLIAITRALETYKYDRIWEKLVKEGMRRSFSWEIPARKYITLFKKAIKLRSLSKK